MAGKAKSINTHPERIQIEKDILKGDSFRAIAERYSTEKHKLSRETVRRYSQEKLPQLISKAELSTVEGIIDRINSLLCKVGQLYDSICDYLEDPEHPGYISYKPNALEQDVTYTTTGEDGKPVKKVASLQTLLKQVEDNGITPVEVYIKTPEPRALMLKTAEVLNKQLELLCKAKGYIKDTIPTGTASSSPTSMSQYEFIQFIKEAIEPYPEAYDAFIKKMANFIDDKMGTDYSSII